MSHSHSLAMPRPSRGAMRLFLTSVVIAIAGAAAAPSFAQAPAAGEHAGMHGQARMHAMGHHRGEAGAPRHMGRMLDHISATEAQRVQIKQLRDAAAPELKAQREAGRALRERQRQVLAAPTIDTNLAEQIRVQMVDHHDKSSRRRTQLMIDIAQVLTPEQRAQLAEMKGKRGGHGRGGMKHGHGADMPRS